MKKIFYFLSMTLMAFALVFSFSSCGGDDDNGNGSGGNNGGERLDNGLTSGWYIPSNTISSKINQLNEGINSYGSGMSQSDFIAANGEFSFPRVYSDSYIAATPTEWNTEGLAAIRIINSNTLEAYFAPTTWKVGSSGTSGRTLLYSMDMGFVGILGSYASYSRFYTYFPLSVDGSSFWFGDENEGVFEFSIVNGQLYRNGGSTWEKYDPTIIYNGGVSNNEEPTSSSEPITGEWYGYKKSSKGEIYCILTFYTGSGRYQEYDKDTDGNVKTTDKNFNYVYAGGKLTITWTGGKSETINVVSYDPNWELVLNNWPDKGNNSFKPLTDDVKQQIESFLNQGKKRYWIYGDVANYPDQKPFQAEAWDSHAMRFSSKDGAHFPTLSDKIYFGYKTLIVEVSDASEGCMARVMNSWYYPVYEENIPLTSNMKWKVKITEQIAQECAPSGDGKELTLMVTTGSCTINSVYYEE